MDVDVDKDSVPAAMVMYTYEDNPGNLEPKRWTRVTPCLERVNLRGWVQVSASEIVEWDLYREPKKASSVWNSDYQSYFSGD
jgi:hypothetical protein